MLGDEFGPGCAGPIDHRGFERRQFEQTGRICAHLLNLLAADFNGEHRVNSVSPEAEGSVAYVDPVLVQQIFNFPGGMA